MPVVRWILCDRPASLFGRYFISHISHSDHVFRMLIDTHQAGARRFTVVQDGRSGRITTTMPDGEVYVGRDGVNDAFHRLFSGAEPRNRQRADDTGGDAA